MNFLKLGACVAALSLGAASAADAARLSQSCASSAEISAVQVSAVVQELTDAALTCGPETMARLGRFQIIFQQELRRSDATLKSMFKRLQGARAGEAAYDAYKTRAINNAERRRIRPGQHDNFCRTAAVVFAAALASDKPVLEDFVSGVPVNEANPVDSCEIRVAVALQGVQAGPDIAPTPRPDMPGDANYLPFPGEPAVGPALRR
jgi:acetyl-CoA acetyltransferase